MNFRFLSSGTATVVSRLGNLVVAIGLASTFASSAMAADGAEIFQQKCSGCHQLTDQRVVGPGLKDVTKRRDKEWVKKFIRNSQALVKAGDKDAVAIFTEFKIAMPEHPLSDADMDSLISYLDSNGQGGAVKAKPEEATPEQVAAGRALFSGKEEFSAKGVSCNSCHSAGDVNMAFGRLPGLDLTHAYYQTYPHTLDEVLANMEKHGPQGAGQGPKLSDEEIFKLKAFLYDADLKGIGARGMSANFILGCVVFILFLGALFYGIKTQRGFGPLSTKEKTLIALGLVAIIAAAAFYFVMITGRSANYNTGYEPVQSFPFSHKRHAGINKIACQYCHFASEQGRHAGIPPTELCMNCHKNVLVSSPLIAQVKEAFESGKNFQWTKVNHFPDHAYFNHAQHVRVGGLQCQQCHGNVETMDVVKQVKPLNMGWCIQCHRSNNVAPPADHKSARGGDCARCHQ